MRLIHILPYYWPAVRYGGPIWSVHALCRALVRRGHEVQVVTTCVDGTHDLDVPLGQPVDRDGVTVRYFPSPHLRRIFWSPHLSNYLRQAMPGTDFLHLHSIYLWPTWAAARLAERHGVPWCVAPRGALVPELVQRKSRLVKQAWLSLIERRTLEGAAFLHATSELEAQDAARFGYRLAGVEIVPNGVDLPDLNHTSGWPERVAGFAAGGSVLLFLGRVSWKKGLDRLIPALAHLPHARLLVAGNDEENLTPQLMALAESVGVAERVLFAGSVYGEEKLALLRNAALLVLPSYSENFGNVVLESLAAGRPVAVTAEVGLAPVIQDADAGFVLPSEPAAMAAKLASALADPGTLDAMGERGQRLVAARYTWDAVADQMESAYLCAIEQRRARNAK